MNECSVLKHMGDWKYLRDSDSWIGSLVGGVRTWEPHTCRQAGRWGQDRGRGAGRGEPCGGTPALAWREVREPPGRVPVG